MARYGTAAGVLGYATQLDHRKMGFPNATAYTDFLDKLLDAAYVRINNILGYVAESGHTNYDGIREVAERRVANILPLVTQMNSSPVIRVSEFTVKIVNMADLWKDLDIDLEPFMNSAVGEDGSGGGGDDGFDISISGGRKAWQ